MFKIKGKKHSKPNLASYVRYLKMISIIENEKKKKDVGILKHSLRNSKITF